jgi:hypothetical protein
MNPNDRDLDDLFGERGGRFGDLYRRLPRYEPPRRLDRAVLGEAARAVRSRKPPRRQRWIVGLGSAAGLVLAAGIAWRIGHEPVATDIGADRGRVVPVQPITQTRHAGQNQEPPRNAPAAAPEAAGSAMSQPSGGAARRSDSDALERARKSPPRAQAPRPAPSQAPKPASAAPEPAPPPTVAARPQPFPEARDAAAGAKTADEAANSGNAAGSADMQSAAKSSSRNEAATSQRLRRAAPSAPPSSSVELQRDTRLSPDDWLSHIRELVRRDRRQQAIESLRLFVRAHPERRVPDDLQPLLD